MQYSWTVNDFISEKSSEEILEKTELPMYLSDTGQKPAQLLYSSREDIQVYMDLYFVAFSQLRNMS